MILSQKTVLANHSLYALEDTYWLYLPNAVHSCSGINQMVAQNPSTFKTHHQLPSMVTKSTFWSFQSKHQNNTQTKNTHTEFNPPWKDGSRLFIFGYPTFMSNLSVK